MATRSAKSEPGSRECPYCKEDVRADALRCRACGAALTPTDPGHGGTCPFCKEQIAPTATRCRHCRSDLAPASTSIARMAGGGFGFGFGAGGLGIKDDACVTMLQNCYIECAVRHPDGDMREGCEDSCDALYSLCRSFS